jgi:L-asparagine transporter-like permease
MGYMAVAKTSDTISRLPGLKSRHLQFIAIGGAIGTGFFFRIRIRDQQSGASTSICISALAASRLANTIQTQPFHLRF